MNQILQVYLAEEEEFNDFDSLDSLIWEKRNIIYGDWKTEEKFLTINPSENVKNNGTLFLHIYLFKEDCTPNPKEKLCEETSMIYRRKCLITLNKKKGKKSSFLNIDF